jgi:hypothetical protein
VDADWQNASAAGDEAVGGSTSTPDQDIVDEPRTRLVIVFVMGPRPSGALAVIVKAERTAPRKRKPFGRAES